MKFIGDIRMWMYLVGSGCFCAVNAQNSAYPKARIDSLLNPPLMKQAERLLKFDKTVVDMGILAEEDAPVTCKFVCTNVSGRPLTIVRIASTCSCVTVAHQQEVLQSGKTQTVNLTFHPKNHPGTIDTNVFVYLSSAGKTPVAKLTLLGEVLSSNDEWARYPYAMGKLRLKQQRMTFGEVRAGQRFTERILCGNSGEKPLTLTALVIPEYVTFHTEPSVIPPGEEADIVITLDASRLPADGKDTFTFPIIIEGLDVRPSDRTLYIEVKRIN